MLREPSPHLRRGVLPSTRSCLSRRFPAKTRTIRTRKETDPAVSETWVLPISFWSYHDFCNVLLFLVVLFAQMPSCQHSNRSNEEKNRPSCVGNLGVEHNFSISPWFLQVHDCRKYLFSLYRVKVKSLTRIRYGVKWMDPSYVHIDSTKIVPKGIYDV